MDTEHQELRLFSEIVQMSKSEAFADETKLIEGLVQESHEAILNCIAGDPNIYKTLVIRYQQSILLKRARESWIESAKQGFETITEAMRLDLERLAHQGAE